MLKPITAFVFSFLMWEVPGVTQPAPSEPLPSTVELGTGITMRYVEAGSRDGETVILLHGITDTSRSFFPCIQALVRRNPRLRLYALDQRMRWLPTSTLSLQQASRRTTCPTPIQMT